MWPKTALLRGNHLAGIRFRGGLSTVGPAQSFPSLKPLNSPPKRLGRLGSNSFTLQQYIEISGCSHWQAAGKTQDRLTTPVSNMNYHLFNKTGFLWGTRLDNGLQSHLLIHFCFKFNTEQQWQKIVTNWCCFSGLLEMHWYPQLVLDGYVTLIQKSHPQLELIQRIFLNHRIFKKLKKLCSSPIKR